MLPRIIGLLGRSRVGKDTVAKTIANIYKHENHVVICRLSQPLKDAVMALYHFTPEQLEDDNKEKIDLKYNTTPRLCMKKLCDFIMKEHGDEFFSKKLFHMIDATTDPKACFVIPDVRYKHDIEYIHQRGGIVIKITRDFGDGVPKHAWEDVIDSYHGDVMFKNNGNIEDLEKQVKQYLCGQSNLK